MIGASKILTVSYGTFSCTLEGFDDPFNTMKAIAEYFRDLAAEDRYFGAEPPTPDAAMLHRIAEREIQRRVEAKIQDNGVILRAAETAEAAPTLAAPARTAPAAEAPVAPAPAPAPVAVEPAPPPPVVAAVVAAPVAPVAEASAPAPVPAEPVAAPPAAAEPAPRVEAEILAPAEEVAPAVSESVAAKLMRIRAAVALSQAAETAPATDDMGYSEDQHAGAEDPLGALPAALLADEPAEDAVVDAVMDALSPVPAEPEAEAAPLPEEIDARFDAFIAQEADELLPEDLAAEAETTAETEAEVEAELAPAPVAAPAPPEPVVEAADDEVSSLLAAIQSQAPVTADVPEPEAILAETVEEPALAEETQEDDLAAEQAFEEDLEEEALTDDIFEEDLEDLTEAAYAEAGQAEAPLAEVSEDHAPAAEPVEDDSAEADLAPQEPEAAAPDFAAAEPEPQEDGAEDRLGALTKAMRARARVIKIRRPATPDAPQETPEVEAEALAAEPVLTPEAEAALMSELAALQAEEEASKAPPPRPIRPVLPTRPGEARRRLADKSPTEDAAVSRLIAQTNSEMEGPENRRRLSAIAHLKAAVIATVAERLTGGGAKPSDEARMDPYRNDLSKIVRPATPAAAGERPSPLVLVSEQRIDRRSGDRPAALAATEPARPAPVMPRRVSSAAVAVQSEVIDDGDEDEVLEGENLFGDARGFADFAERLGARNLADLMEAAAAYTTCIEGRPHFSRPYLIRQVSTVLPEAGTNRENSLRGFGTLLREGRIQKVRRGQYALAESSRYLAEARKLAG